MGFPMMSPMNFNMAPFPVAQDFSVTSSTEE
jgi:hypothetical protein